MKFCLKQAKQTHDAYVEQRLQFAEKQLTEYAKIIRYLVEFNEGKTPHCDWSTSRANSIIARSL